MIGLRWANGICKSRSLTVIEQFNFLNTSEITRKPPCSLACTHSYQAVGYRSHGPSWLQLLPPPTSATRGGGTLANHVMASGTNYIHLHIPLILHAAARGCNPHHCFSLKTQQYVPRRLADKVRTSTSAHPNQPPPPPISRMRAT